MRHLCVVAALVVPPTTVQADRLVVLNKSDHEAALVDPATRSVLARIPTGKGPHEVAVSPDGRLAYVSNYGMYNVFREGEKPQMEPGNTITVIDLERQAVRDTFDLGEYSKPHGIRVSSDASRLWVTCEGSKAVLELDSNTGKILEVWKTEQEVSHMLVPTPDERKLYVANIRSGSATVIERASGRVRSLPTGDGAEGIDVTPDGREVWVTNRGANTISVIDATRDTVLATIESGGKMPIRVRFTPDGRHAWVSNARSNSVTVFDAAKRKRIATIEVDAVPVGIEISPDGKRAYVACTNDNVIKVLDVPRRRALEGFTTGNEPDGMAWAASRRVTAR